MEWPCLKVVTMSKNKNKIFIATPISAFKSKEEYAGYRKIVLELIKQLKPNYEVYSEIELIRDDYDYESPEQAAVKDLDQIDESDIFIIHHPKRLQTSTFIELGYALALKKKIIIISSLSDLPYLANGIIEFENVYYLKSHEITKNIIQQLISIINKI